MGIPNEILFSEQIKNDLSLVCIELFVQKYWVEGENFRTKPRKVGVYQKLCREPSEMIFLLISPKNLIQKAKT